MNQEINWKNSEAYEIAITQWLIKTLRKQNIKETHFSREAGLGKNETDARTFRKIKEGKRHWSITDLCKLAAFFDSTPSEILEKVESFYQNEGIVIPGKTVEKIIELGLSRNPIPPRLISTWQKQGKNFVFLDCDPDWKKVTKNIVQRVVGMTSKQIFPYQPEITESFERAWNDKGEDSISIDYRIRALKTKSESLQEEDRRLLLVNSKFVPPNNVVAYVDDISQK